MDWHSNHRAIALLQQFAANHVQQPDSLEQAMCVHQLYMDHLVQRMNQRGMAYVLTLEPSGSSYEGVSVGDNIEFDMLATLQVTQSVFQMVEQKPGYYYLQPVGLSHFPPGFINRRGFLSSADMSNHFRHLLEQAATDDLLKLVVFNNRLLISRAMKDYVWKSYTQHSAVMNRSGGVPACASGETGINGGARGTNSGVTGQNSFTMGSDSSTTGHRGDVDCSPIDHDRYVSKYNHSRTSSRRGNGEIRRGHGTNGRGKGVSFQTSHLNEQQLITFLLENGMALKTKTTPHGQVANQITVWAWPFRGMWYQANIVPCLNIIDQHGNPILFVPQPSETDSAIWRQCYSIQERDLLNSADRDEGCRKQCLRILKTLRQKDDMLQLLNTYHFKNVLLNEVAVKTSSEYWQQSNVLTCLMGIIYRLEKALKSVRLNCYFTPGINLMEGLEHATRRRIRRHIKKIRTSQKEFEEYLSKWNE